MKTVLYKLYSSYAVNTKLVGSMLKKNVQTLHDFNKGTSIAQKTKPN